MCVLSRYVIPLTVSNDRVRNMWPCNLSDQLALHGATATHSHRHNNVMAQLRLIPICFWLLYVYINFTTLISLPVGHKFSVNANLNCCSWAPTYLPYAGYLIKQFCLFRRENDNINENNWRAVCSKNTWKQPLGIKDLFILNVI